MNIRFRIAAATAMMLALSITSVHAQDLKLVVDRDTGDLSLTGVSGTVVDLAGYRIGSDRSTIVTANFNGLRDTEADWVEAGISSSGSVSEVNSNGNPTASTSVNDTLALSLGLGAYSPTQALLDAGFGVDVEANDLSLTYYDTVLNQTSGGVIEFAGEKLYNNIGITVDLADGSAIIENESPFDQVITGYLIESTIGADLNTDLGSFTGLRGLAAGASFQAPSALDGDNLGELDPSGAGIALNAGGAANSSYGLGTIGGALDGLTVSFILQGEGSTSMTGFVKYLPAVSEGIPGDYNLNGSVEQADLDLVLLNWGVDTPPVPVGWVNDLPEGQIDQAELDGVLLSWGNTAASATAVPEPGSVWLGLLGCAAIACLGKRNGGR